MTLPVHQHLRVEAALEANFCWWANHRSPQQATRWYEGFLDAEIRQLTFGVGAKPTHRALFVIRPDMVYVISIRHLAQQSIRPEDLA